MSNKVVHFEIPADDVDRAREFYGKAFGWQITPFPGMPYWGVGTTPSDEQGMPTELGGINGGMMQREGPATSPVLVIEVDSVDASLEQVQALGGSVALGKTPVGDMGFFAYFTDPEGNLLGVWETTAG